jgi:hypothetical protein
MPIDRKARLRPGAIHPSLVDSNTGLSVDEETGVLSASELKQNIVDTNVRIDSLYWRDPIQSNLSFEGTDPNDFRVGEAYFSIDQKDIYIYVGDLPFDPEERVSYQPQSWVDANRDEKFLLLSTGLDASNAATKEYVDTQIANLIGGAPDVLDTLNDLVQAINNDPNFGATILDDLARLELVKADKDDVYTKDEIDTLELEILNQINEGIDQFANVVDYVCGTDSQDDNINIEDLWLETKPNVSQESPKNYLIKQNVESPEGNPLTIDKAYAHFLGFHPSESDNQFSYIKDVLVNFAAASPNEKPLVTSFTNISFSRFVISNQSEPGIIIFNNCLFSELPGLSSAFVNENLSFNFIFNKCKFFTSNNNIEFFSSKYYFNDCDFESSASSLFLEFVDVQPSTLISSRIKGSLLLSQSSELLLRSSYFQTTEDEPFITVTQDATLKIQRVTFDTPQNFTSYYIAGNGTAYFDYNIVDISLLPEPLPEARLKQPTAAPTLNDNAGADIYHFFDPLGSSNFFYNDEKARDAIAAMIELGTHSTTVAFSHDDLANSLSLVLTFSTQDLTDADNIAYLDAANVFTALNTFTSINTNTLQAIQSITSPLITTNTADQTVDDETVATTAYVRQAIRDLRDTLFTTELEELSDVSFTDPSLKQVLGYNGTTDPTKVWTNFTIDSTWLSDSDSFIRPGDSVFLLSRIEEPTFPNQVGDGTFTGGYDATSQILAWNGQYVQDPSGTDGAGAYVPVLINQKILYAGKEQEFLGQTYDGAGKIWIAEDEEIPLGQNETKAVTPYQLYQYYTNIDASNVPEDKKKDFRDNIDIGAEYLLHDISNIPEGSKQTARDNLGIADEFLKIDLSNIEDPDLFRQALGFPGDLSEGDLLEVNSEKTYSSVRRVLPYYKDIFIDFYQAPDNVVVWENLSGIKFHFADPAGAHFYNVQTKINETNYLILPSLNGGYDALSEFPNLAATPVQDRIGPIIVRKSVGSTHVNSGTLSVMCGSDDDMIMSSDSIVRYNTVAQLGPGFHQAQIDLVSIGHTVIFWPMQEDGEKYWYAEGYYHLSGNQQQPDPVIEPDLEIVQDAIESFFDHTHHSRSISIGYDDPNHRLVATQHFANQAEVNAGIVNDLPIAPNTFKTYLDAFDLHIQQTYSTKAANLSDLTDIDAARANLLLGTASSRDAGFEETQIPYIGQTFESGYVFYDPELPGLKTSGLPVASTLNYGLVMHATLEEFEDNDPLASDEVVTVENLHQALATDNDYTRAIKRITNSLFYVGTNTVDIDAEINTYYSLATDNGSITITLPDIALYPLGSEIMVKYRLQVSNQEEIVIAAQQNQFIDGVTSPYTLDIEGQSIRFILGVNGWEIN